MGQNITNVILDIQALLVNIGVFKTPIQLSIISDLCQLAHLG